jgi:hypothetical protein
VKGTITKCLAELIENEFGRERWDAIVADAKIDAKTLPLLTMPMSDVDDAAATRLFESTCRVLGVSLQEAADAFGEYWCCTYAPRVYQVTVEKWRDARDAILSLDEVHIRVTQSMKDARPPRFEYEWADEDTLDVTYKSHRKLLPIYMGLARGVGAYFDERLNVQQIASDRVRIEFL